MKSSIAIAAFLCIAGTASAQTPGSGAQQKPPAQHQAGTSAAPVPPAHMPGEKPTAAAESSASASDRVDPAKEEAIRHLMDITQTSKLGDSISAYITGQVRQGVSDALAADTLPKFMESFSSQFSAAAPASQVTDAMVPIYAKAFSLEDIQGLIQFYESPLGQRVVKTLPDVSQQSQIKGLELQQTAALKVLRGMTDQYPELKKILPPENAAQPGAGTNAAPLTPNPAPAPKP